MAAAGPRRRSGGLPRGVYETWRGAAGADAMAPRCLLLMQANAGTRYERQGFVDEKPV